MNLVVLLMVSILGAGPESLTEAVRAELESQFRASTGLGFSAFHCDEPAGLKPGQHFNCVARDEEDDQFFYRIETAEDADSTSVHMSQPAAQLPAEGLALIEGPCRLFIDRFIKGDWSAMHAGFSAELQQVVPLDSLPSMLTGMREALGEIKSSAVTTYANPSPNLHLLEYALSTQNADVTARFEIYLGQDLEAQMMAFLVQPDISSTVHFQLLKPAAIRMLQGELGETIRDVAFSLSGMSRLGQVSEGLAIMEEGEQIAILVELAGSRFDFDVRDYKFHVVDGRWIVQNYLQEQGTPAKTVTCPHQATPDGGSMDCRAQFEDGSEKRMTLRRWGSTQRLIPEDYPPD